GFPLLIHVVDNLGNGLSGNPASGRFLFFGYLAGSAGLLAGAALISTNPNNPKATIPGGILAALGAVDLGMTVYRHFRPGSERPLSFVPLVAPDGAGGVVGGVGVRGRF